MSRLVLIAAVAAAGLLGANRSLHAQNYEGPWCAHVMIGEGSVAERCDMRSFQMCLAEISGQGASHCTQNPRYRGPTGEPQRRRKPRSQ